MVKAIFFDIDGTLVSFQTHQVPASTREAISALRAKGIKVFIATGRHMRAINNLGDMEFDGYITMNGSYCLEGKDEVIYRRGIPKEDILAMIDYQEKVENFPSALVQENAIWMNYSNQAVEEIFELLKFSDVPLRPLREVADETVYQVIAFFQKEQQERIMSVMPHAEATRWNPMFSDVVPHGSSKAVGIDKMLEHFGIALEDSMAFGDGGNDVEMLQHVPIGIAMGNAEEEVKAIADYVTDTVDNDGILKALKHFGVL